MANPLAEIFRYNAWANEALFAACQGLDAAVLGAPSGGDDPRSIRTKLLHIAGAQQTFCLRTKGRQHEGEINAGSAWPGWEAVNAAMRSSNAELIEIAGVMDADIEVILPYMGRRPRFPRSFFLAHAIAHGAQHRTEVVLALRALGHPMPDLDGWSYAAAAGHGKED
jgi:uncharacterized damage-inducible protein DinB